MHLGFLGVEFFFIVSGCLMANTIEKQQHTITDTSKATIDFIIRKINIFFPYYIFSYVIGFIILHVPNFSFHGVIKDVFMSIPNILQLQMAGFNGYQVLPSTWYLSAMLLSMAIIFPLALNLQNIFYKIIAPIVVVFIYGYFSFRVGNLAIISPVGGDIIQAGLLRGIAGISLGCICFKLAKKFSSLKYSHFGKNVITISEIFIYTIVLIMMNLQLEFRLDFVIVILFAIGNIITFSQVSNTQNIIKGQCSWIGKLAMVIFLVDPIARNISILLVPSGDKNERVIPCVVALMLLSYFVLIGGKYLKYLLVKTYDKVGKNMIEEFK